MKYHLIFSLLALLSFSCKEKVETDLDALSAYTKSGILQAVIEIPAGTSHKIKYHKAKKIFEADQKNGSINFLPYPANHGFIPSTIMSPEHGGDGEALDILVISESLPTGTVIEVIPIALLRLKYDGKLDSKVIAIPADKKQQSFKVDNYDTFSTDFIKAKLIIEYWFTNYRQDVEIDEIQWQDGNSAKKEILHWLIKKE